MKLRVHYQYGNKVKRKDFGEGVSREGLEDMANLLSANREPDNMVTLGDAKYPGFSVPARNIVLMEIV